MAFRTPRPMARRDSRLQQYQERVPADLRRLAPGHKFIVRLPAGVLGGADEEVSVTVGKHAVRFSLRTADPALVKRRHAVAREQVERIWEALRGGPITLTTRQRVAFAGLVYRYWRTAYYDEPERSIAEWSEAAAEVRAELGGGGGEQTSAQADGAAAAGGATDRAMEQRFGSVTDLFLSREGLLITEESRRLLLRDVGRAMVRHAEQAAREAGGDFSHRPISAQFPSWHPPARRRAVAPEPTGLTFTQLYEAYERLPGKFGSRREATKREFRKTFVDDFAAFVLAHAGHNDPARVTHQDVVAWRDKLLAGGLSAKTVKDKKIAAVKAVYARAANDGVLPVNPAAKIDLRPGKRPRERESGFTDAEAKAILKASDEFKPGRHSPEMVAAIRWVPWIGAYTGARITEITQLRGEDVFEGPDGWIVRFTPEAGGIKTGNFRDVPIHACLIDRGFLEFVTVSGKGPLFYKPDTPGQISRPKAATVGGRISEWVRKDVGITDKRVQPTHGWRHRFKTVARRVGMEAEARDYIQGHTLPGMGAVYGDMAGLAREMAKLPRMAFTVGWKTP